MPNVSYMLRCRNNKILVTIDVVYVKKSVVQLERKQDLNLFRAVTIILSLLPATEFTK